MENKYTQKISSPHPSFTCAIFLRSKFNRKRPCSPLNQINETISMRTPHSKNMCEANRFGWARMADSIETSLICRRNTNNEEMCLSIMKCICYTSLFLFFSIVQAHELFEHINSMSNAHLSLYFPLTRPILPHHEERATGQFYQIVRGVKCVFRR